MNNYTIDQRVISEFIMKAAGRYEKSFLDTLAVMLEINWEKRPRWGELEEVIIKSIAGRRGEEGGMLGVQG